MFCPNCGNEVKDGVKFCDNCGTAVSSEQSMFAGSSESTDSDKKRTMPELPSGVLLPEFRYFAV